MRRSQKHTKSDIPQIVRIKRKRGQDPLQALVLEGRNDAKRSKTLSSTQSLSKLTDAEKYYFELASTGDRENATESNGLTLSEASPGLEKRRFVIPKLENEKEDHFPMQLHQMLDEFLSIKKELPEKLKKRRGSSHKPIEEKPHDILEDYVFDVYRLSTNKPLTSMNYPQTHIGYIRFFDDEETDLVNGDESNDPDDQFLTDDEDSNAESFYQNDYPEDEDIGEFRERYEKLDVESDEDYDDYSDIGPVVVQNALHFEQQSYFKDLYAATDAFDNIYDKFYEDRNRKTDFLHKIQHSIV